MTLDDSRSCTNCAVGSPAFSKCMECCELLCDSCAQSQQCGHQRKDHKISRYPPNPISPPQNSAGSRASSSGVCRLCRFLFHNSPALRVCIELLALQSHDYICLINSTGIKRCFSLLTNIFFRSVQAPVML